MNDYLALALGVAAAGAGGELFVRGAVGLARSARVSPAIIGATVAAFATSSPELAVSTSAALAGNPRIALGDALGSNIVNVALILGLAAMISRIHRPGDAVRRDFAVALLAPAIIGLLLLDGALSRIDGSLLIAVFLAWLALVVIEARRQRSAAVVAPGNQAQAAWNTTLFCLAGLAFLAVAGHFVVTGAKGLATSFGIDEFVVGATIVAVGTSVPELATAITAKLRGHDELGLGTILGSNVFNSLFIVGVTATISPIVMDWHEVAVALAVGVLAVAFVYPGRGGTIERGRGAMLLVLYGAYLAAILHGKGS